MDAHTGYLIDSAVEYGEITPLEATCLSTLDSAYREVYALGDMQEQVQLPEHFFENTARRALGLADKDVQYWVALRSLQSLDAGLQCVYERAQHIVQTTVQCELGIRQAGPLRSLFDTPSDAHEIAAISPRAKVLTPEDVTETAVRSILSENLLALRNRLLIDADLIVEAADWYRRDQGHTYRAVEEGFAIQRTHLRNVNRPPLSLKDATVIAAKKTRQEAQLQKKARSAVKKVSKLFAAFGREQDLRLFVSGREVTLSHPDSQLKFVLKPLSEKGWLLKRSVRGRAHTPYDLGVYTKDDVFVARLCVYIDDSPVLDQLLALTMFIEAGDEMRLLEKANWFSHNLAAKETVLQWFPQLESKYPSKKASDGMGASLMLPAAFRRELEHWEPFRGRVQAWVKTWFEPVTDLLPPLTSIGLGGGRDEQAQSDLYLPLLVEELAVL